ncbi:MAG TPA: sulfate permease, partial [Deltaproteobacteria bacterium]|nr:sulfate permease [Deltaproteobacteria bacterium]
MRNYRFDRLEIAGSLGDLGTLLPLAIGMILINGLNAAGLFFTVGVFYILSGIYFGVTVPVQPMKVIGAYAIATGLSAQQIQASGLLIGAFLLIIGVTGTITLIGKYVPKPVVRGVQLSTGTLLMAEGVRFMIGTSRFQVLKNAAESYLALQAFGPIPIGIIIGFFGGLVTLL